jgi:hypothetical protein
MMMPANLVRFIRDNVANDFSPFGECFKCLSPRAVETYMSARKRTDESTKDPMFEEQLNQMLQPLLSDSWSFQPGAWWISRGASQVYSGAYSACKDTIKLINQNTDESLQTMLRNCTGTGDDNTDRITFYKRTLNILTR